MGTPDLHLIAAVAQNNVIGRDGDLPWRLPDELKHFRRLTMGQIVLMGRKTFESLPKRLDGRDMWVLSRKADFSAEGIRVFADLQQALAAAGARPVVCDEHTDSSFATAILRGSRPGLEVLHAPALLDAPAPGATGLQYR